MVRCLKQVISTWLMGQSCPKRGMEFMTAQSQTIQNINQVIQLAQTLMSLYTQIVALNNAWNDDGSLAIIQAFNTCPQNADGTLGTQDTTINPAHPINPATYPGLIRAVSSNSITSALTQLNNVVSFINGNAVAATPNVRSLLNQLTGG
jgi:hypothetical protein